MVELWVFPKKIRWESKPLPPDCDCDDWRFIRSTTGQNMYGVGEIREPTMKVAGHKGFLEIPENVSGALAPNESGPA